MDRTTSRHDLRNDILTYAAILAIAGLQVVVAYRGGTVGHRVVGMLSLGLVQAALGILFFMHMLREKKALRIALLAATLLVVLLMNGIWSDSFRLLHLAPWAN